MSSNDPRSSSTQSLVPDPALEDSGRRRLLLIYIHGFMGDETSFRSFPAHVHNLVTVTLADSHVVHTKVYPRYKSRDSLQVARDNFSAWLAPHEDPWTDIILVGHSMGGLLAADIALAFRHRIIGVVNFDVPFLGMHPGIIKAGLGSIFNAPPPPQDAIIEGPSPGQKPTRINTLFNPKPTDPNYNPSFANDVHLPNRKGWENSLHWLTKHYKDGLAEATKGLVKSHLEFGGAMADYKELKDRYARIRALEEDDEAKRKSSHPMLPSVPRVRFVNYYTVSTGRPKKQTSSCPQRPKSPEPSHPSSLQFHHQDSGTSLPHYNSTAASQQENTRSPSVTSSDPELAHVHPDPIASPPPTSIGRQEDGQALEPNHAHAQQNGPPDLPEIPPIPQEPPFVDLLRFNDKTQRKAAEKEYEQALKEYQKAVKARNKIINERTKMEEKWDKEQQKAEKKWQQEQEKRHKEQEKAEQKRHEEEQSMSREERQRQKEREQRQAEAEQREKEARQRQREADLRQGITPAPETPEPVAAIVGIEEDVSALQLHQPGPPRGPYGHYEFSTSRIMNQAPPDSRNESMYALSTTDSHDSHPPRTDSDASVPAKRKKLKKFCMLPPKDSDGNKDPTWIAVFMDNMDEVTAHTSLFFLNQTYERLVGEAGARIEEWVREADSMRLIQDMQYQGKS
ncbi:hypothetical protein COCC4DRAFT_187465 [Bipolaris maydis ATCC 48331]|uniref:AB hydrolase-1 domain-containing protein n=3 Tax=Cochliobolus heterostrophus TaxID=5016 RepID=M2UQS6_COCH5|nr:uncharacterized protein COCC4DRAFT_187465 [Bipolaris maydis ATCC 48331]EMD90252.1 hypothetical protein COCHEDRAFT_1178773 [Bipolaris maydis C5]KAJ5058148.1 hypothetical protein J3E74DRAFT_248490 [Bipolaris maydis]ENI09534.1 hypothetical protein COCC4DRAFT_187465 [Bipolaris maydis ATCC 48331]KAJ6195396.1 hypothetical protein J3E72DRAFT_246418 [Bipolaris maydis]KAJ6206169.1 hypothetical protein PSV09DRAFT_1178773 [Bipolaris maydis]